MVCLYEVGRAIQSQQFCGIFLAIVWKYLLVAKQKEDDNSERVKYTYSVILAAC